MVCTSSDVRHFSISALLASEATSLRRKHDFRVPLQATSLFVAPGGACIACLDRTLVLHVLEALALRQVASVNLDGMTQTCDTPLVFTSSLDGHVLSLWTDSCGEVQPTALRLELLEEFSAPEPPSEVRLWERSRAILATVSEESADDARKAGGMLGSLRTLSAGLKRVMPGKTRKILSLDDVDVLFPAPERLPAPRPPRAAPAPVKLEVGAARAELLGESSEPKSRSVDDIRQRYGRPVRPAAAATSVAGTMGENLTKLNERGEKLSNILEKTQRMESDAMAFAESARKLKEQQQLKGLFGGLF